MTASAGIAVHHGIFERTTIEGLLRRADAALYQAKHAGRDRLVFERALAPPVRPRRRAAPLRGTDAGSAMIYTHVPNQAGGRGARSPLDAL